MRFQFSPLAALLSAVATLVACDTDHAVAPDEIGAAVATDDASSPAPAALTATTISRSEVALAWRDDFTSERGFEIHRSTSGPGGSFSLLAKTDPNVATYRNTGLTEGKEYCYKVRAILRSKRTAFSSVACARPGPPGPPPAPTGATAYPASSQRIDVQWTDHSTNRTGTRVERSSDDGASWTTARLLAAYETWLADEGRTAEQRLCYRVIVLVGDLESVPSNTACTTPPAPATNLTAKAAGPQVVELTWTDNSAVESGYSVLRWTKSWSTATIIAEVPANATSYRDVPPVGDSSFTYRVDPKTADGGRGNGSNEATVWLIGDGRPRAPTALDAAQHPHLVSYAQLTWTNNATNAKGYRVERAPDAAGPWSVIQDFYFYWTSSGGTVPHELERHACYRIIAFNEFGSSEPSNVDCLTLPASPTDLVATAVNATTIDLAWKDNSSLETSQEILRSSSAAPGTTVVITIGADVTSYRDAGLVSDVTYTYAVVARTPDGLSGQSNTASAPTASQAPATPTGLQAVPNSGTTWGYYEIYVGWNGTANTAEYRLWRSDDGARSWTAYGATSINAAWDQGIVPDREHCYRVTAVNVAGESPPSDMDCAVIAAQPTILSWVETDGITEITWTDNSNVEDGYEIRTYSLIDGFVVTAWLPPNTTSWSGYLPPEYNHAVVAVKDGGPQL